MPVLSFCLEAYWVARELTMKNKWTESEVSAFPAGEFNETIKIADILGHSTIELLCVGDGT